MAKKEQYDQATLDAAMERQTPRLQTMYKDEVRSKVAQEFGVTNTMAMPALGPSFGVAPSGTCT